jgi:hypothetical protein
MAFGAAALSLASVASVPAIAVENYTTTNNYAPKSPENKPLVILRFNQDTVYFHLPLKNAVENALRVHPTAFFEVVSVIPTTGDFKTDEENSKEAFRHTKDVMHTLHEIGVPKERFETSYVSSAESDFNEVRIYVH